MPKKVLMHNGPFLTNFCQKAKLLNADILVEYLSDIKSILPRLGFEILHDEMFVIDAILNDTAKWKFEKLCELKNLYKSLYHCQTFENLQKFIDFIIGSITFRDVCVDDFIHSILTFSDSIFIENDIDSPKCKEILQKLAKILEKMIKDLYSNLDYSKISDQSQNFQNVDRFFILIKSLKQYLKYHPNCSKYIQKETISQLAEIFNKNFITADFESVLKPDVKDLCYTFEIDENLEKSLHSSISSCMSTKIYTLDFEISEPIFVNNDNKSPLCTEP